MISCLRLAAALLALTTAMRAEEAAVSVESFSGLEVGPPPDKLMVVEGSWGVVEEDGDKRLELQSEPVVDAAILIGPSMKGEGAVRVKIRAAKGRRAQPRFGVGLFGVSGVKVRVSPAQKKVELVHGDEVMAESAFEAWTENVWWQLELKVSAAGESWQVEARLWPEGTPVPERPTLAKALAASPGQGRASLLGAPYANKPIHFDDVLAGSPAAVTAVGGGGGGAAAPGR